MAKRWHALHRRKQRANRQHHELIDRLGYEWWNDYYDDDYDDPRDWEDDWDDDEEDDDEPETWGY